MSLSFAGKSGASASPTQPERVELKASDVPHLSRAEFKRRFKAEYAPGQHVTFIGPTQRGKTTLCFELLHEVISPAHKCIILSGKPPQRDPVMQRAAKQLDLRIVEEWPPMPVYGDRKRNGFILQPRQRMKDLDADNEEIRSQFRRAMMANYASSPKKPVITVCDEAAMIQNDLKLKKEYEAPLVRGAPVNAQWSLIQRNRYNSMHAYSAPEWIFFFQDPDYDNVTRDAEMVGGIDRRQVVDIIARLPTYRTESKRTISEVLAVRRSGPELCVIGVA